MNKFECPENLHKKEGTSLIYNHELDNLSSCSGKIKKHGCIEMIVECSFKGTASIKMCEIDPSHVKETSFTCSLVIH